NHDHGHSQGHDHNHDLASFVAGKRVTVMGLGILGGGVGVAQYLATHGAHVTVTDMRDADSLGESIHQLQELPITYHLGGHEMADFTSEGADIVVRNPGVRPDSPYLVAAREDGVGVEMEMSLFFRACPAPILGVTGTKGKTSVSTLCGHILHAWKPETLLAGNMGISALAQVDRLTAETPVVIELSSFQLEALDENRLGPHIAVITNISEDHLDRYDDYEHYIQTKLSIGRHLQPADVVVFDRDDPQAARVAAVTAAHVVRFGIGDHGEDGAWLAGNDLVWRQGGQEERWPRPDHLSLQGDHGARNVLAAVAATRSYGAPYEAVATGLASFAGVENRMEEIATIDGVLFVNDTSATAPAATIAALDVLVPRAKTLHLIAGGSDKQTDLHALAGAIAASGARVLLLDGSATPELRRLIEDAGGTTEGTFGSMPDAVRAAVAEATSGDIVALSPGCASFGMFRNEFDRGGQFAAAVGEWGADRSIAAATATGR
ncbi:MAG: UDP-N-acetylmuramoyl-L-alanine--D-glutamate ligase, partial [Thermomicrobiales bacterium]